jgi:mRNA-degrading endonuclease RelE of RelBE toxin-antitoxin system
MDWQVKINKTAKKYLDKIEPKKKEHLSIQIKELKNWIENRSQVALDIRALKGPWEGKFTLRIGNLRLIFEIILVEREIRVLYIGPRGDVY